MKKLVEGKKYRMVFPVGSEVIAILDRIETYPASGMPNDFIFQYVSGDDGLAKASRLPSGMFPLPGLLLPLLSSLEEVE